MTPIYSLMLLTMVVSGLSAGYQATTNIKMVNAIIGSVLFVFSDLMIAYKSIKTLPFHDIIIMSSYYTAQINLIYWSVNKNE